MKKFTTIQLRRDTEANYIAENTILASGEPAFAIDTKSLKIGDGASTWLELEGVAGEGGSGGLSQSQVITLINSGIATVIDESPALLNTLNEIAAAIGDNPDFISAFNTVSGIAVYASGETVSLYQDLTIVSGIAEANPFNQDLNTTDFPSFSGVALSNGTTVAQGTFDNSTGGQSGISLNCYVGYELNWQGGHLKSTSDGGITASNIWLDSAIEFLGVDVDNMEINSSGIVFPDGTTQNSAPAVNDILAGKNMTISSLSGDFTIDHDGNAEVLKTIAFNKTGSQIPKASVVYINGGQGDLPTIDLANASGEATSTKTYGITAEVIDNMSSGNVVVAGALVGIDTDQYGASNGTTLWLSPSVSGAMTVTKPSAPNHAVSVGTIVRTHQNEGVVEVRIQNGYEVEELHNVAITNVAHNDVLVYNSGTSLWENNDKVVLSDPANITGASGVNNIVKISQGAFDALGSVDPNTIYFIV